MALPTLAQNLQHLDILTPLGCLGGTGGCPGIGLMVGTGYWQPVCWLVSRSALPAWENLGLEGHVPRGYLTMMGNK